MILLGDGPGRLLELEKEVLEGTGRGEEKKCLLRKKMYVIDRTYLTINTRILCLLVQYRHCRTSCMLETVSLG